MRGPNRDRMTLHLFTGMRTKACRRLGACEVRSTMPIEIVSAKDWYSNGTRVFKPESEEIARDDGFESTAELVAWFEKTHGLPFRGVVIRW